MQLNEKSFFCFREKVPLFLSSWLSLIGKICIWKENDEVLKIVFYKNGLNCL